MSLQQRVVETLVRWKKEKSYINKILATYKLEKMENKAMFYRVALGSVQNLLLLDFILKKFIKKGSKLKDTIYFTLIQAIYSILYIDELPDYAIVNESVAIIKKSKFKAMTSFVNAILRNIVRGKTDILSEVLLQDLSESQRISIKYSVPEPLLKLLLKKYSNTEIKLMLLYFQGVAPIYARINISALRRFENIDKYFEFLKSKDIDFQPLKYCKNLIKIQNMGKLIALGELNSGRISIQDLSAFLTSTLIDKNDIYGNVKILDICAAPGGKTIHLADRIISLLGSGNPKDYSHMITACDIADGSMQLMTNNIKAFNKGIEIDNEDTVIDLVKNDATVIKEDFINKFDIIIADIPCSGLGVIARKPDIKYYFNQREEKNLIKIQHQILDNAFQYLKKGGIMIYSTCTLLDEENIEQVRYLKEKGMKLESLDPYFVNELQDFKSESTQKGYLEIKAGQFFSDGFFMARLRKE